VEKSVTPAPAKDLSIQTPDERTARKKEKKDGKEKKEKSKKRKAVEVADENDEEPPKKHKAVLTKFEKSSQLVERLKKKKKPVANAENTETALPAEGAELHGMNLELAVNANYQDLTPLPQPSNPPEVDSGPIVSSLPPWLSNPTVVQPTTTKPFKELGLSEKVLKNLESKGFTAAFSIQTALIPLVLPCITTHRGDICVSAPTGSGKTLGYAIPLVEILKQKLHTRLRAVVVVPTRDLVQQVTKELEMLAAGTGVRVGTAFGRTNLSQEQKQLVQVGQMYDPEAAAEREKRGRYRPDRSFGDDIDLLPLHVLTFSSTIDILVCTPGRLVEHIKSTRGFSLDDVEFLVIDEADRLLNDSFQGWAKVVVKSLRPKVDASNFVTMLLKWERVVKKIILSATMTRDVGKLAALQLRNPTLVSVTQSTSDAIQDLPSSLCEVAIPVGDGSKKPLYLLGLLRRIIPSDEYTSEEDATEDKALERPSASLGPESKSHTKSGRPNACRILVFTNSNEDAMRLRYILVALEPGFAAQVDTLTKMSSKTGRKALSAFKGGKTTILIASDRASRGLDVPDLSDVVSYDVPRDLTTYVHRAGRTARAGKKGTAWSFYTDSEGWWFWNGIARAPSLHRGGKVHREGIDMLLADADKYEAALDELKDAVAGTSDRGRTAPDG
jgi:ATP-dependent RNA helicase DDX51/DBP6